MSVAAGRRALDWIEVLQLKHSYHWHFDEPDLEALLGLFTEDAVLEFGPYGTWTGPEEIRAGYEGIVASPGNAFASLHAVANPIIQISGDEGRGRWYLLDQVLTGAPSEPTMRVAALYHDAYRRTADGWRISGMRLQLLWNAEIGRLTPGSERKLDWHPDAFAQT